jgi:DNA polymerase sigma
LLLQVKDLKHKGFEIDISANKILDVYNSKLLLTYAQLDERFHALALILKDWNKK